MLQAIGAVRGARRIEQQREGRAGFFLPGARLPYPAKRNDDDPGVEGLDLAIVLTQLRHVLAAGQSTQVPQEHQQHVPPTTPRFR